MRRFKKSFKYFIYVYMHLFYILIVLKSIKKKTFFSKCGVNLKIGLFHHSILRVNGRLFCLEEVAE